MNRTIGAAASGLSIVLFVACGGAAPPAESVTPTPSASAASSAPSAAAPTFQAQATAGQKLYADNCAGCHGASGEGAKAPRLVGMSQGALPLDPPATAKARKTKFKTAADVADFVVKAMPPGQAGKLSEEQYWSILAFDLKANGVDLGDKRLDATTASSVVIHP